MAFLSICGLRSNYVTLRYTHRANNLKLHAIFGHFRVVSKHLISTYIFPSVGVAKLYFSQT